MMRIGLIIVLFGFLVLITNSKVVMANPREIKLPQPHTKGDISLEEAVFKRRSERNFLAKDLTIEQISQLLWAAQGITAKKGGLSLRAAPSAGALFSMEIYVVRREGLSHYLPQSHSLEVLNEKDLRKSLCAAAWSQSSITQAPVTLVICAMYPRITAKYGERGIRYTHIEAGHIAQNIHLQAVALGLGSVPIGAFNDTEVQNILNLPQEHEPLYLIPVGYPISSE